MVYVATTGVGELHRELTHRNIGITAQAWTNWKGGMTEVTVIDPFNNRIIFGEPTDKDAA